MNMYEEEIIQECETRFQNGGPKVYVFDPVSNSVIASPSSAYRALLYANPGEQVWARRKVSGRCEYRWRAMHKV